MIRFYIVYSIELFEQKILIFYSYFRFFLADMYNHLLKLHSQQFLTGGTCIGNTLVVYRGQLMRVTEFNHIKDNAGHLISVGTFFSTSKSFDVASIYSSCDSNRDSELVSVMFEIEVDLSHHTIQRPFASIEHLSQMPDECEVLFSVGSIFRIVGIENVQISNGQYWHVKMNLVEDDNDIKELRRELEDEYCHDSNLCDLGKALTAMGDYERAERYFRMLLEYLPETHSSVAHIYGSLGRVYSMKADYQTALQYYEQTLKCLIKIGIFDEQENIRTIYVHIGAAYHQLGKVDLALKYYSMSTDIKSSPSSLSYTYNQIAMVHRDKGDHRLALEYFQRTLHIEEQVLKKTKYHPLLATMYNNIGEIYIQLNDDENAFKYLQHALNIRLKGTVSTHTDLAAIYSNLGLIYQQRKELKKALEMFEKALEIDTQTFHDNHESLALSHNNIGRVYMEVNDLDKALYHAQTGLKILLRSQARDNSSLLAKHQCNLATIQVELGNYTKALKMAEKTLYNQLEFLPENHEHFAVTYHLFSTIYKRQGDISKALEYLEKSVENARISILPNDMSRFKDLELRLKSMRKNGSSDVTIVENSSTHMICVPDNSDLQDRIILQSSEKLEILSADNIIRRIEVLCTLISTYSKKENFQMAMKYFDEANTLFTEHQSSDVLLQQKLEESMVNVFFSASRIYYRQKNWTMSLKMLTKSLEFALKQNHDHLLLAEIYNCMGLSYHHQLDPFMTIHYLKLAIDTAKKKFPDDHPDIQRYYSQLQQLKPFMGGGNS